MFLVRVIIVVSFNVDRQLMCSTSKEDSLLNKIFKASQFHISLERLHCWTNFRASSSKHVTVFLSKLQFINSSLET